MLRRSSLDCTYGSQLRQGNGAKCEWLALLENPSSLTLDADIAYLERRLKNVESRDQASSMHSAWPEETGMLQEGMHSSSSDHTLSTSSQTSSQTHPSISEYSYGLENPRAPMPSDKLANVATPARTHTQHDYRSGEGIMSAYRGYMGAIESLRNLRRLCGPTEGATMDPAHLSKRMADALDRSMDSILASHSLNFSSRKAIWFSSEAQIHRWIDLAFENMFTLWPFIDRESFNTQARDLFECGKPGPTGGDPDHLGLTHAVIALGQRYDPELMSEGRNGSSRRYTRG